ncbi:MAG: hypothetical protein AAFZ63_26110 [Bacteroidota bacterium]
MTDQEKIERYLANELPPAEQKAFEQRLAAEPKLAESLSLYQATQDFFQRRNPALESTLDEFGKRYIVAPPWYRRWWLSLLVGTVLFGGSYYTWNQITEVPAQPTAEPTSPKSTAMPDSQVLAPVPSIHEDTLTAPASEEPSPAVPGSTPDNTGQESAAAPIAAASPADFAPNSDLEELLNTIVRDTDFFTVEQPASITTLSSEQSTWQLRARTTIASVLELRVYSNASDDFYKDQRVLTQILQATKTTDTLDISQRIPLPEQAGLYYWLILDRETEELRAAGKFVVE